MRLDGRVAVNIDDDEEASEEEPRVVDCPPLAKPCPKVYTFPSQWTKGRFPSEGMAVRAKRAGGIQRSECEEGKKQFTVIDSFVIQI